MWETAINLLIAIWLVKTGLQHPHSAGVLIVAGTLTSTFGFYVAAVRHCWQSFTIGMIGLWLFLCAVIHFMPRSNVVTSGLAIGVFSIWAMSSRHVHEKSPGWS